MALELDAVRGPVAAGLFLQSCSMTLATMSSINSTPVDAADPAKAATAREYLVHALVMSGLFAVASAAIGRSWWPIAGAAATDAYLWTVYDRALKRGQ